MYIPARLTLHLATASLTTALLFSAGCDDPAPAPKAETQPSVSAPAPKLASPEELAELKKFQRRTAELLQGLSECSNTLTTMGQQFLQQPDPANLDTLKTQWQACFELYSASTLLTGYTAQQQQSLQQLRANLGNELPMPGFIDSVQGYPHSGIVNDASLPLDAANLRGQHGLTDDADVSIGFHVVAFLLWGEQRQSPQLPPRPATDYLEVKNWEDSNTDLPVAEHPNNRRRRLLTLTLQLLAEDSQALLQQWQEAPAPNDSSAIAVWRRQQIRAFIAGLDTQPDNTQLSSHIQSWLADQVIPGSAATADSEQEESSGDMAPEPAADDARQQLSRALNRLLTEQG